MRKNPAAATCDQHEASKVQREKSFSFVHSPVRSTRLIWFQMSKHRRPRRLPPLVKILPSPFASAQRKVDRDWYQTPEHKAWRRAVLDRAGWRCQAVLLTSGERCKKAAPDHRLYADHVIEIEDGGSPTDLGNGQCLCYSHHGMKTALMRSERQKG